MKVKILFITVVMTLLSGIRSFAQEERTDTLNAAVLQTDKYKKMARSQTSLKTLDNTLLKRGFAMLGSPDLVKTMQMLPGVSSGTELLSGLYVRGGDGSDNLYLLDGVPMYQTSHLIGLFSSFNVDMVEDADFYKGGFPARYGGRLSSVVDVNVRDGSFDKWCGNVSLGLLDGRIHIDGPIIKDKLSLNFGIRRSWADLLKTLATPMISDKQQIEMIQGTTYVFSDINMKVTQLAHDGSKISLSLYGGRDYGKMRFIEEYDESDNDIKMHLGWGNMLASLKWNKHITDKLLFDSNVYYTSYSSIIGVEGKELGSENTRLISESNESIIHDVGCNLDLYCNLVKNNRMKFGCSVLGHNYAPARECSYKVYIKETMLVEKETKATCNYLGAEMALYMEDEIDLWAWGKVNIGFRENLFFVNDKHYNCFEPRIALRANLNNDFNLKASFSETNQFAHQLSSTYLDLPTNIWMPSTSVIKPMNSKQWVAGFQWNLPRSLSVDVELWYKDMKHLYEYQGANTMLPAIDGWELYYNEGKGRSYGIELGLEYKNESVNASVYYTLSKSERLFPSYYYDWYPDRNDNRHKLNIQYQYRINNNFLIYAAWLFHSGNHFTAASAVSVENDSYIVRDGEYCIAPNLYSLPAYHRLDLGLNWYRTMKNGRIRTLNFSLYNAYCHFNAISAFIRIDEKGKLSGRAICLIPIIPSISYNWTF